MKRWIHASVFLVCLVGLATAPLADADAATFLKIKGAKAGVVKGAVTMKGFEGAILVESLSHEIVSPRDPASGLATGKRQHKPMTITKRIDKSSPILANMLATNENISTWQIQVFEKNSKGADAVTYKVDLTNASIASIKVSTNDKGELIETISFTYQKIEWTWVDGNITGTDDWEQQALGKSK